MKQLTANQFIKEFNQKASERLTEEVYRINIDTDNMPHDVACSIITNSDVSAIIRLISIANNTFIVFSKDKRDSMDGSYLASAILEAMHATNNDKLTNLYKSISNSIFSNIKGDV